MSQTRQLVFTPDHQHLIINAKLRNPPRSPEIVADWLSRLVQAVGMEVLDEPYVCECADPGNEGITGVIVLSTSHCSIHIWSSVAVPYANIDLYSCKGFALEQIQPLVKEFDPYYFEYQWVDRNDPYIQVLKKGFVSYPSRSDDAIMSQHMARLRRKVSRPRLTLQTEFVEDQI